MIPMLSDVKNALLAEYNLQQQIGFCDEIIDGYSGFVFQNRFGSLLSSNDINRALNGFTRPAITKKENGLRKKNVHLS